jgi:hypothetical protein
MNYPVGALLAVASRQDLVDLAIALPIGGLLGYGLALLVVHHHYAAHRGPSPRRWRARVHSLAAAGLHVRRLFTRQATDPAVGAADHPRRATPTAQARDES